MKARIQKEKAREEADLVWLCSTTISCQRTAGARLRKNHQLYLQTYFKFRHKHKYFNLSRNCTNNPRNFVMVGIVN